MEWIDSYTGERKSTRAVPLPARYTQTEKESQKWIYIARALWQEENHKLSFSLGQISTMNKQHEKEND